MSAVRIVLVMWGGLFLVLGPLRSPGDGDLYWQRWLGDVVLHTHRLPLALGSETFTSAGAAWVPQEWLFSTIVAAAAGHGLFVAFSALLSAVPLGILGAAYLRSRGTASPEAIAVALLFCGMALLESFGIRAQVLGWACFAVFLLLLERRDRWVYAAFPVAVLWANLHGSVMIAPAIVLVRIAAAAAGDGVQGLRNGRDLRLLPLVFIAPFCTPLGWRLPAYAIGLVGSPIRQFITEWQPSGLHDGSFLFGALPLTVLVLAGGLAAIDRNKLQAFPVAMLFVAMVFASRNIPLFAIAAAPLAAKGLDVRLRRPGAFGRRLQGLEPAALASICAAVVVSALCLMRLQRMEPPRLPDAAFASIAVGDTPRRVFCEDFSWCSLALQYPHLRVFMDGRCDPYPVAVWTRYIAAIRTGSSWSRALVDDDVDTIVAARGGRFAGALDKDASWHTAFADRGYVVFRRE